MTRIQRAGVVLALSGAMFGLGVTPASAGSLTDVRPDGIYLAHDRRLPNAGPVDCGWPLSWKHLRAIFGGLRCR